MGATTTCATWTRSSLAPAAGTCATRGDCVGESLELVPEWLQRTVSSGVHECPAEQPVRENRVAGKQGAVEIRADGCTDPAALEP